MIRRCVVLALFALALPCSPALAQQKPRKVAFLVGVGSYKHTLPDLSGIPEKDVAALEPLLKEGGFTVHTLTGEKATRKAILAKFKSLVDGNGDATKALGKGDILLVQCCMHGFTVEVDGKAEPFLAGYDARPEEPSTLVGLNELIRTSSPFGVTSLFLVDACRENNDPNRGAARGVEGTQMTLPKNTAVLFSCGQGQLAYQPAALGHGLFTDAVLKTLRGDTGWTGDLTWADLVSQVGKKFQDPDFAKHIPAKKTQTPLAVQGETADVKLLKVKPKSPVVSFDKLQLVSDEARAHAAVLAGGDGMGSFLRGAGDRLGTWKAASAGGEVAAHYLVARSLLDSGEAQDRKTAVDLLVKAAKAGYPWAMGELGRLYATGAGVEKNLTQAFDWYRKGAEAGNPPAMYGLAVCYEGGRGATKNLPDAVKWYEKAAEAGHVEAMASAGLCHERGRGVPTDPKLAATWYEKAATAGEPNAMNNLGYLCQHGTGVPQDHKKALEWYQKSANLGNAVAMANVAFVYQNAVGVPRDYAKARQFYEQAATLDNVKAMNELGYLYQKGLGAETVDFEVAVKWYSRAAGKDDADGCNNLGYMTQHGLGTTKDGAKALELYKKAAATGHADATNNVGYCLENGVGVAANKAEARKWYEKAANLGHDGARKALQRLRK